MASVCVDIDLGDVRITDLIEELRRRHKLEKNDLIDLSPQAIVNVLEDLGCPQSIIKQLDEWANQPVVDMCKLLQWKEACAVF